MLITSLNGSLVQTLKSIINLVVSVTIVINEGDVGYGNGLLRHSHMVVRFLRARLPAFFRVLETNLAKICTGTPAYYMSAAVHLRYPQLCTSGSP